MKRTASFVLAASAMALGASLLAQSAPDINFDANAELLNLPSFGEVAGVATNSRGHVFVYARTGHAVATLGDERTFYHGGSRLFEFDQSGKFVKEIGQGVYAINFAQQVRIDPQDNIWVVDAGSNAIVKFDSDGRYLLVLNADNVVEQRRVELGQTFGQMRQVESGLKPDERVVVAGIQDAIPGQKVDPQLQTPKSAAAEPAPAAGQAASK